MKKLKKSTKRVISKSTEIDVHQSMFIWSIIALGVVSFLCWVLAMYVGLNN